MNCEGLLFLLDDGDLLHLDAATRREVDAHLSGCASCRQLWLAQQRIGRLPDAKWPEDSAQRLRAAVARSPGPRTAMRAARVSGPIAVSQARNRALRGWRLGAAAAGIVTLAAAAAFMTERLRAPAPIGREADRVAMPASPVADGSALAAPDPVAGAPLRAVPAARDLAGSPAPTATTAGSFTVRLLPPRPDMDDGTLQRIAANFHPVLAEQLQRVPGLVLQVAEAPADGAADRADFEIGLEPNRRADEGRLRMMLRVRRLGPQPVTQPVAFDVTDCEGACLENLARSSVDTLRRLVFPFSAEERQSLVARVQDAGADPDQRLAALRKLRSTRLHPSRAAYQQDQDEAFWSDQRLLQAVTDLAGLAPDPEQRADVWELVRGLRQPALIDPLLSAAVLDVDSSVRFEATRTLRADYASHPRVRSALEQIATTDLDAAVRQAASPEAAGVIPR